MSMSTGTDKYISLFIDATGTVVDARVLDAETENEASRMAIHGGTADVRAKTYELWRHGCMTSERKTLKET